MIKRVVPLHPVNVNIRIKPFFLGFSKYNLTKTHILKVLQAYYTINEKQLPMGKIVV